MTLVPIVRKILLGAAESSLDIAGAALLPGAWPILKGALGPVLSRLKERLGGQEVTSSQRLAEKAADLLEADQHLQEVLRSALVERLDQVVQGRQSINDDVQKLLIVVSGDQRLITELIGDVARLGERIEAGVNLSDEAIARLAEAVSRQAEGSRAVRAIALRAMGPVADLLQRQLQRLQVRAVELVQEGAADRALDELQEGLHLVAFLLDEAPTDLTARLQLGFIYKTFAQVAAELTHDHEAEYYIDRAETLFDCVVRDVAGDPEAALEIAGALHGLGNVEHTRGNLHGALARYREALRIHPGHPYALHDIFVADYDLARDEPANLTEMRQVLERLKAGGTEGVPGLGARHITDLERVLLDLEDKALSDR